MIKRILLQSSTRQVCSYKVGTVWFCKRHQQPSIVSTHLGHTGQAQLSIDIVFADQRIVHNLLAIALARAHRRYSKPLQACVFGSNVVGCIRNMDAQRSFRHMQVYFAEIEDEMFALKAAVDRRDVLLDLDVAETIEAKQQDCAIMLQLLKTAVKKCKPSRSTDNTITP